MAALRTLLISQLLACLWVSSSACLPPVSVRSCVPFTGLNGCVDSGIKEPKLPPRDNDCCGPHCTFTALNGEPGPCDNTVKGICLLDTHCDGNVAFSFKKMSGCTLRCINEDRLKKGFARLLSFNWNQATCEAQNTKCGINCCCRETCPTQFCKIQTVTT